MANNFTTTSGITTTSQKEIRPEDLAPNNYLTIIWKDVQTGKVLSTLDIDNDEAISFTNQLNSAIDNAISNNNVSYVGQNKYINLESIAKYIAQNSIDNGTKLRVVNALIGVASGSGKKLSNDVTNLCLNVFGEVADKTARKLGFSDPQNIFSQVAGQNVIGVLGELGKQTKSFLDEKIKQINSSEKTNMTSNEGTENNKKNYVGLLLGLTTSDTESYEVTIPRKKIENGSDYTTHLLPQPFKKEFSVKLTNKVLSSDFSQLTEINAIEYAKDKMIEIAQSKTLFDIYIRLSADKVYKRSNVTFSSLSFTKDEGSGNSYTATFTIEPINSFKTKYFISNKKYLTGSKGTGQSGNNPSNGRKQTDNTSDGKTLKVEYITDKKPFNQTVYRTKDAVVKDNIQSGNWVYESSLGNRQNIDITFATDSAVTNFNGVSVLKKDLKYAVSTFTTLQGLKTEVYPIGIIGGHIDKKTGRVYIGKTWYKLKKGDF